MDEKDVRLFLPEHHDVKENPIKKKIRQLMYDYELLKIVTNMDINPHSRESLELYSCLYNEMSPLLTAITCHIICINGYRHKKIRESINHTQKILGLLKILNERYVISLTSNDYMDDMRWFTISNLTCKEIVEEIKKCLKEVYPTKRWKNGFLLILFSFIYKINKNFF